MSKVAFQRALTLALGCCILQALGCTGRTVYTPRIDTERVEQMRLALGSAAEATRPAEPETATAEPKGWASLSGTFKVVGSAPPKKVLNVRGDDVSICAPGGKRVFSDALEIGADGGLKNVLVYLTTEIPEEEPWTHPSAVAGAQEEVIFDQKECRFLSHVLPMKAGQTLKILNSDPTGHNTNLLTKQNMPFNQTVPAKGEVTVVLKSPERQPFNVKCSIHPWMSAYIMVCSSGYFAVTDENGAFDIPNIPAGVDLEFRIWHERTGFLSGIEVDGQSVKKGKLQLNLSADQAREINVNLDAAMFN